MSESSLPARMNVDIDTKSAARVGWEWAVTCTAPLILVCDV